MHVDRIYELTKIDKWFLYKLKNIINIKNELVCYKTIEELPPTSFFHAKINGFSDFQIARHVSKARPCKDQRGPC
ncbi:MAG: hypothetical protein MZV63_24560 [Marinilabiliales bacterium]|nr:hypothetical protein [Marinilabiliales bacterium]